jgi:hypothetical protein
VIEGATVRFVNRAAALPPESLAAAFDLLVDLRGQGGKEASRAAIPSAAENSELDHIIRGALRPRAAELKGLRSDARAAISTTARAILKRANLTPDQYKVLIEPFVGRDVEIPPHPRREPKI